MSGVRAAAVMELRQRTGVGMMECKRALVECGGDLEHAIDHLRQQGSLLAAGKAGRVAAEGAVLGRIAEDRTYGVLAEINSETDFVARDENFLNFAQAALDAAFMRRETEVDALLEGVLEAQRIDLVQKLGENISVRRIVLLEMPGASVFSYVHNNHRIAALAALRGGDEALGRDLAMQVAAAAPRAVRPQDMPQEEVERERKVLTAQAAGSGKSAAIAEKMTEGRLQKFLAEHSLIEQPFIRDPQLRTGQLLQDAKAEVLAFIRFEVGDGIERKDTDFAAEVASQLGNEH